MVHSGRRIQSIKEREKAWRRIQLRSAPPGTPESGYMSHNLLWINGVMDRHGMIINIGPQPGRELYPNPTSPYYRMELEQIRIRNYPITNIILP